MSTETKATMSSPWILLPPSGSVDAAWAREVAQQVASGDAIAPAERVLAHYQALDTLDGFAARVLFAPNMPEAILTSVAAVPAGPDSVADQRSLIGLDQLGDFSGQLDDLRHVGLEGYQLLRVDPVETDRSADETVLTGTLLTVVRRTLSTGTVDLVAVARSTDLLLVAAAVEPVIELLLGEDLAQLLGG
jgi:hypothetical protein